MINDLFMEMWLLWVLVGAFLLIVEVLTQSMWALCIAVGAFAAMVCSLLGMEPVWTVAVVIGVALGTYACLLPVFRKWHLRQSLREARTGMDALLGRRAIVTHEIKPDALGRGRIDGDNWQLRAPGVEDVIKAGERVIVTGYDSIILTVEREKN